MERTRRCQSGPHLGRGRGTRAEQAGRIHPPSGQHLRRLAGQLRGLCGCILFRPGPVVRRRHAAQCRQGGLGSGVRRSPPGQCGTGARACEPTGVGASATVFFAPGTIGGPTTIGSSARGAGGFRPTPKPPFNTIVNNIRHTPIFQARRLSYVDPTNKHGREAIAYATRFARHAAGNPTQSAPDRTGPVPPPALPSFHRRSRRPWRRRSGRA